MNRLDQIEARANAATEGPWASVINDRRMYHVVTDNEEFCQTYGPELYDSQGFFSDDDTEFIAHSRADVPEMAAALRAVLELHKREESPSGDYCDECFPNEWHWPCSTVATIRQRIGDDL